MGMIKRILAGWREKKRRKKKEEEERLMGKEALKRILEGEEVFYVGRRFSFPSRDFVTAICPSLCDCPEQINALEAFLAMGLPADVLNRVFQGGPSEWDPKGIGSCPRWGFERWSLLAAAMGKRLHLFDGKDCLLTPIATFSPSGEAEISPEYQDYLSRSHLMIAHPDGRLEEV